MNKRPNLSPGCTYLGSAARFPHTDGAFSRYAPLGLSGADTTWLSGLSALVALSGGPDSLALAAANGDRS